MTFWDRFYALCRAIDKYPNTVCKELGFSNATSTKWKNGSVPSGKTIEKIASYFKVSTDYLLGKEPEVGIKFVTDHHAIDSAVSNISEKIVENIVDEMFIDSEEYQRQTRLRKWLANADTSHVIEIPSDVIDCPVAIAVSADSDEELKSKIKQIVDGLSEEKLKEVLPYAEYVRDKK